MRLLVVGGAGSLYVDAAHTRQVMDGPDFPDAFKPLAANMGAALAKLRGRDHANWTCARPRTIPRSPRPSPTLQTAAGGRPLLPGLPP